VVHLNTLLFFAILIPLSVIGQQRSGLDKPGHQSIPRVDPETGSITIFRTVRKPLEAFGLKVDELTKESVRQLGKQVFVEYYDFFKLDSTQVVERAIDKSGTWWYGRYRQQFLGVEVYGTDIGFTISKEVLLSVGARMYPDVKVSTTSPTITTKEAIQIALADFEPAGEANASKLELRILANPNDHNSTMYSLVWMFDLSGLNESNMHDSYRYFVDALTGRLVKKVSNIEF
jgi:Zn-dependent metalloprotease